jgi:transcriptional regulator
MFIFNIISNKQIQLTYDTIELQSIINIKNPDMINTQQVKKKKT